MISLPVPRVLIQHLVAVLASLLIHSAGAAGAAPLAAIEAAGGFRIEQIADGVYAAIRSDAPGLMVDANCVFIVNDQDVVVVDAPEASGHLIAALRTLTDKPVSFLVNTHWHDDHVIGNAAWRAAYPAVRIIGYAALVDYLPTLGLGNRRDMIEGAPGFAAQMQTQMARGLNLDGEPIDAEERAAYASDIRLVEHYMAVVPGAEVILSDLAITDTLTLRRGTRRIEIRHAGRAHTAADLIVWLPHERVLVAGDIVGWPVPLVGAEQSHVGDWPATLDALLALQPLRLVPGHGPVMRDTAYAQQLRALFAEIDAQVAGAAARGLPLDAVRREVNLAPLRSAFAGSSRFRGFAFDMYVTGPALESAYRDAARSAPQATP